MSAFRSFPPTPLFENQHWRLPSPSLFSFLRFTRAFISATTCAETTKKKKTASIRRLFNCVLSSESRRYTGEGGEVSENWGRKTKQSKAKKQTWWGCMTPLFSFFLSPIPAIRSHSQRRKERALLRFFFFLITCLLLFFSRLCNDDEKKKKRGKKKLRCPIHMRDHW